MLAQLSNPPYPATLPSLPRRLLHRSSALLRVCPSHSDGSPSRKPEAKSTSTCHRPPHHLQCSLRQPPTNLRQSTLSDIPESAPLRSRDHDTRCRPTPPSLLE